MLNVIQMVRQSNFLKMNLVFFVGSLLVAFFNYLYYPILGRLLSTEQFGELQVLVSLFIQATIFLNVMALVSVNIMTKDDEATSSRLLIELERLALLVAGGVLALMMVMSPLLARTLRFEDQWGFIVIALVFAVSVPLAFRTGYLRGKNDFGATSIGAIMGSISKIAFSVLLVYIGWETLGAVAGILLAQTVALLYTSKVAARHGRKGIGYKPRLPNWPLVRPELPFIVFVFFVSFVVTILFSVDVAIVKYFFSPEQAGSYAGISTVARIVYFLTASIAIVLLSAVKPKGEQRENIRLLGKSLLMTAGLGGIAAVTFCVFPEQIVHLLMGEKFDQYVPLLPLLSVTMFFISLANVLTSYHMAVRDYAVAYITAGAAIFTTLLTLARHETIEVIVQNLFLASVALCLLLMLRTGFKIRSSL